MDDDRSVFFPEHDPPPGGLEKLCRRLESESRPGWRRYYLMASAPAAVLLCAAIWFVTARIQTTDIWNRYELIDDSFNADAYPTLFRLGIKEGQTEAVMVPVSQRRHTAVERVALENADVIYYRISMLDDSGMENTQLPDQEQGFEK